MDVGNETFIFEHFVGFLDVNMLLVMCEVVPLIDQFIIAPRAKTWQLYTL